MKTIRAEFVPRTLLPRFYLHASARLLDRDRVPTTRRALRASPDVVVERFHVCKHASRFYLSATISYAFARSVADLREALPNYRPLSSSKLTSATEARVRYRISLSLL